MEKCLTHVNSYMDHAACLFVDPLNAKLSPTLSPPRVILLASAIMVLGMAALGLGTLLVATVIVVGASALLRKLRGIEDENVTYAKMKNIFCGSAAFQLSTPNRALPNQVNSIDPSDLYDRGQSYDDQVGTSSEVEQMLGAKRKIDLLTPAQMLELRDFLKAQRVESFQPSGENELYSAWDSPYSHEQAAVDICIQAKDDEELDDRLGIQLDEQGHVKNAWWDGVDAHKDLSEQHHHWLNGLYAHIKKASSNESPLPESGNDHQATPSSVTSTIDSIDTSENGEAISSEKMMEILEFLMEHNVKGLKINEEEDVLFSAYYSASDKREFLCIHPNNRGVYEGGLILELDDNANITNVSLDGKDLNRNLTPQHQDWINGLYAHIEKEKLKKLEADNDSKHANQKKMLRLLNFLSEEDTCFQSSAGEKLAAYRMDKEITIYERLNQMDDLNIEIDDIGNIGLQRRNGLKTEGNLSLRKQDWLNSLYHYIQAQSFKGSDDDDSFEISLEFFDNLSFDVNADDLIESDDEDEIKNGEIQVYQTSYNIEKNPFSAEKILFLCHVLDSQRIYFYISENLQISALASPLHIALEIDEKDKREHVEIRIDDTGHIMSVTSIDEEAIESLSRRHEDLLSRLYAHIGTKNLLWVSQGHQETFIAEDEIQLYKQNQFEPHKLLLIREQVLKKKIIQGFKPDTGYGNYFKAWYEDKKLIIQSEMGFRDREQLVITLNDEGEITSASFDKNALKGSFSVRHSEWVKCLYAYIDKQKLEESKNDVDELNDDESLSSTDNDDRSDVEMTFTNRAVQTDPPVHEIKTTPLSPDQLLELTPCFYKGKGTMRFSENICVSLETSKCRIFLTIEENNQKEQVDVFMDYHANIYQVVVDGKDIGFLTEQHNTYLHHFYSYVAKENGFR